MINEYNTYEAKLKYHPDEKYIKINYKYSEDKILKELTEYINSTYSGHYSGKTNVSALDMWESLGTLFTSSRDVAIKYLCRAKKKGSKEDWKKDIFKTMHYCLFMLHSLDTEE